MPSLLHDIPVWVRSAGVQQVPLRQAVHCVLETIARTPRLRALLCMKGGILMALHYDSPRFTTDIDFSTPDSFTEEAEKETVALMSAVLPGVGETLGYDVECRLQGHKVRPNREGTRVNLTMNIGYALKGTPAHRRLAAGQSPFSLQLQGAHPCLGRGGDRRGGTSVRLRFDDVGCRKDACAASAATPQSIPPAGRV